MKARTWSEYYSNLPFEMYSWSIGKILHIPFKSLEHTRQNEGIMKPMNLWSVIYEITDKQDYTTWCCERNEQQQAIEYLFETTTPTPCIIQRQAAIQMLYQTGKLNKAIQSNVQNPERHVNKLIEEINNEIQ